MEYVVPLCFVCSRSANVLPRSRANQTSVSDVTVEEQSESTLFFVHLQGEIDQKKFSPLQNCRSCTYGQIRKRLEIVDIYDVARRPCRRAWWWLLVLSIPSSSSSLTSYNNYCYYYKPIRAEVRYNSSGACCRASSPAAQRTYEVVMCFVPSSLEPPAWFSGQHTHNGTSGGSSTNTAVKVRPNYCRNNPAATSSITVILHNETERKGASAYPQKYAHCNRSVEAVVNKYK